MLKHLICEVGVDKSAKSVLENLFNRCNEPRMDKSVKSVL